MIPLILAGSNARDLALVAIIAVAPLAIVIIVALLRGYTIDIHLTREERERRSWRDRRNNGE